MSVRLLLVYVRSSPAGLLTTASFPILIGKLLARCQEHLVEISTDISENCQKLSQNNRQIHSHAWRHAGAASVQIEFPTLRLFILIKHAARLFILIKHA